MLMSTKAPVIDGVIVLRQVRSAIGRPAVQRQALIALGLNKIGRVSILPDIGAVLGQHRKVEHLVSIVDRFSLGEALDTVTLTRIRTDPHGRRAVSKFLNFHDPTVSGIWEAAELLYSQQSQQRITGIRRISRLLQTRRDAGRMETSFTSLAERDIEILPRLLYRRIFGPDRSAARQAAYSLVANSTVSAGLDPGLDAQRLGNEAAARFREGLVEFLRTAGVRFVIEANATAGPAAEGERSVDVEVTASRRLGFDINGGDVLLPEVSGSLGPETPVVASPVALESNVIESWRAQDLHKGDHRGDLLRLKVRMTLSHGEREGRPLPVSFLMLGAVEHRDLNVS